MKKSESLGTTIPELQPLSHLTLASTILTGFPWELPVPGIP